MSKYRAKNRLKFHCCLTLFVAGLLWLTLLIDLDFAKLHRQKTTPRPSIGALKAREMLQNDGDEIVIGEYEDGGGGEMKTNADGRVPRKQSPIDINSSSFVRYYGAIWPELRISYEHPVEARLKNTGQVIVAKLEEHPTNIVHRGPLQGSYVLANIVFHWGSEHTLNGYRFAGEIQLLHFNKAKYQTFIEAVKHVDGIVIISVFLKLGQMNRELQKVIDNLEKVNLPSDTAVGILDRIDITKLLPSDLDRYWTYAGSLTTYPTLECVTWIILANPIDISPEQLAEFRKIHRSRPDETNHDQGSLMVSNYRQTMPVNDRIVQASWNI